LVELVIEGSKVPPQSLHNCWVDVWMLATFALSKTFLVGFVSHAVKSFGAIKVEV